MSSGAPRQLALVGPTGTGKSELAVAVARALGEVEIVSVDSMQVYRGMNIGTAKPTVAQRGGIAHHLIDVCEPTEEWSVARFAAAATDVVDDIEARGRRPLFVGGTGLYARAVVDRLELAGSDPQVRAELEAQAAETGGVARLRAELAAADPLAASRIEATNTRRIVRALEVVRSTGRAFSAAGPGLLEYAPSPISMVGVWQPRELLRERVRSRFSEMVAAGLVDEVRALARGPLSRTAREAIGYRELLAWMSAGADPGGPFDDAVDLATRRTIAFARRQRMWFRRDPRIRWLGAGGNSTTVLPALLALWSQ